MIHETAAAQRKLLNEGGATSVELTRAHLDQIEKHDGQVGAYLSVNAAAALEQAENIDKRRQAGEVLGSLAGLPVAIKDVLCTDGQTTTCGSRMLENFAPQYDLERVPGGSSGGAAACVAASMAPLSVGTDTGGSIRQPAGFCGVVGMKPTYGRVSRYGLIAFASSLDQAGPLARTAEDTALLLDAIGGHAPRDSTSAPQEMPSMFPLKSADGAKPLDGIKLGIVKEHFGEGLDGEIESSVREVMKVYESLGAKIVEVELPHSKYAIATYYIVASCEASSNLSRYD